MNKFEKQATKFWQTYDGFEPFWSKYEQLCAEGVGSNTTSKPRE
ncbi:hypothetical protein [uncultured Microscilla sp.]|nr:hypothetical protein [uncultured Microscilla sp.]